MNTARASEVDIRTLRDRSNWKPAKARTIGYWIATMLIALAFLSGGIANVLHAPEAVEGMVRLGYPPYFVTILGVWKILGAATVLAPGLPRLKEWAYAGMTFDLTGAVASHAIVRAADSWLGTAGHISAPLVLAALVLVSWALRPESRRP